MLELLIKLIAEAAENARKKRLEAEIRAGSPAMPAAPRLEGLPAEGPRRKKKKKRRHEPAGDGLAPALAVPRAPAAPVADDVPEAVEAVAVPSGRDLRRLFVLGEVLGPPLALRDDE